jgi:hypothetical protein
MALFFTITLAISILGVCGVLWGKHWELTTGQVLLGSVRPRIDRFFQIVLFWIERVLPLLVRVYSRRAAAAALVALHRAFAWMVLEFERLLERTLHTVRHTTDAKRGEASAFLREVAEHKKRLLHAQNAPVRLHKE